MAAALRATLGSTEAGTAVDMAMAAPAATMLEELPKMAGTDKTAIEQPPSMPQGTVVEASPMPSAGVNTDVGGGTAIEAPPAKRPTPPLQKPGTSTAPKKSGLPMPMIIGGLAVLGIVVFGGIFLATRGGRETPAPTEIPAVIVADTAVPTQTAVPEPTEEIVPTEIPTETAIPPTPTPETPYVVITGIRLENNAYVVDFEMHNSPPDLHVHMFFDTVPPEQAGSPGAGPWKLAGGAYGPSPFTGYGPTNRPPNANQMCSLIANPNHSVQPNSGNCVDLP
jgi:hypothetical protein